MNSYEVEGLQNSFVKLNKVKVIGNEKSDGGSKRDLSVLVLNINGGVLVKPILKMWGNRPDFESVVTPIGESEKVVFSDTLYFDKYSSILDHLIEPAQYPQNFKKMQSINSEEFVDVNLKTTKLNREQVISFVSKAISDSVDANYSQFYKSIENEVKNKGMGIDYRWIYPLIENGKITEEGKPFKKEILFNMNVFNMNVFNKIKQSKSLEIQKILNKYSACLNSDLKNITLNFVNRLNMKMKSVSYNIGMNYSRQD